MCAHGVEVPWMWSWTIGRYNDTLHNMPLLIITIFVNQNQNHNDRKTNLPQQSTAPLRVCRAHILKVIVIIIAFSIIYHSFLCILFLRLIWHIYNEFNPHHHHHHWYLHDLLHEELGLAIRIGATPRRVILIYWKVCWLPIPFYQELVRIGVGYLFLKSLLIW